MGPIGAKIDPVEAIFNGPSGRTCGTVSFISRRHEFSTLQGQIREFLVSAILEGRLDPDEPLPSTRKMAKTLGVSRNTVVLAYQALVDDGYLDRQIPFGLLCLRQESWKAVPGSGHARPSPPARARASASAGPSDCASSPGRAGKHLTNRSTGRHTTTRSFMARLTMRSVSDRGVEGVLAAGTG